MNNKKLCLFVIIWVVFLLSACSANLLIIQLQLDTPSYHVKTGFKFMDMEKFDDAYREFKRAGELDPRYSPAHVGLGLILAHQRKYEKGLSSMGKAVRLASGKKQKVDAYTGYMRLYTFGKSQISEAWLTHVKDAFQQARKTDPESPAPYFYLGIAYKTAKKYDKAVEQFVKVFEIDKGLVEAADREYTQTRQMMQSTIP